MREYFPLNQGDKWIWEIVKDSVSELFVDGDINLGEPFIDYNKNGVYDPGEDYEDLNSNGKYDGPNDPWTPGIPYIDRNSNGEYDPPNGIWDEGEEFCDLDGNGICGIAATLTLYAQILYRHHDAMIRGCLYPCASQDAGMWAGSDHFTNDSLGLRWHGHTDRTDWYDFLATLKPITIAKANIQLGDSVVNIDTSYVSGHPSGVHTWISIFQEVEDVTVPAGNFPNCLKFKSGASGWTGNMQRYNGTSYQWYAENVGLLKSEGPEEGEYWILKSATVGGKSYP